MMSVHFYRYTYPNPIDLPNNVVRNRRNSLIYTSTHQF